MAGAEEVSAEKSEVPEKSEPEKTNGAEGYSDSKPPTADAGQLPPGNVPVTLKVADDAKPGQTVYFTTPYGQQMQATIPDDKQPGDEFTVMIPALTQRKVKLTVPEGVEAGASIVFRGPFGYDMQTAVPEGKQPGDVFYVYVSPPPPQQQAPPSSYTLTVPEGLKAGDELYFQTVMGQQMRAIVPEGKGAGDTFQVQLGPSQMNVTVPEGKSEGDEVEFMGPGGVLVKAIIPKGKKAGDQFAVSLLNDPKLSKGLPALCTAAANGDLDAAKRLIEEPEVDVNGTYENGFTPLFYAATSGHAEVAKWLLEVKADVLASNETKRTPLHWAARNGHSKVAELLIEAKAELNGEDGTGRSPLALALGYDRPEVAEMLRKAGAEEPAKKEA
eukprot:TRINITY_DN16455_c0_g1_i1.p1 TRINITY_DN16455_c0_g1~~TRINITY_DN16455_c0_g1_i1.p1  ORF type:complete len:386 (-),score=90.84 TRINITY_DN16455_c0_g1_i1:164-1321(-)